MAEEKESKTQDIDTGKADNKSENESRKPRKRLKNAEFFSQDILGDSQRDRLLTQISLGSSTAQSLYNMTYDRVDAYLHRPKELSSNPMARDAVEQMDKIITTRFDELELYIDKRYRKVKQLFEAATAIEKYDFESGNKLETKAGFSTAHSKRYLELIKKVDEIGYMANYLEKIGQFDIRQEANINSEVYRRSIVICKNLVSFIGRAVIGVRRQMRDSRQEKLAS